MTGARYSPEVEEALIGAALNDRRAIPRLVADLVPTDFYTPALGAIFGAVVELHQSGYAVDQVTITDHLRVSGQIEAIGDPSVLLRCMNAYGGSHLIPTYVAAVRREATARSLAALLSEGRQALESEVDPLAAVDLIEGRLRDMSRAGQLPERYWRSTQEYLATDRSEALVPLAEGVCYPLSRIMLLAATEKGGKSILLRQMACCFAAGLHPFNPKVRIEPVRTLLFDVENDDDELATMERIRLGVNYWAGPDAPGPALYSVPYGVDLATRRDLGDFLAVVEDYRPQLIIGGPIYKMTDQTLDLSEDRRAAIVQTVFNDIRKRWGSAVILEHHAPSAGVGRTRDVRAKGGQVWAAWVNMTIALHPINDGDSVEVRMPHPPWGRFRWPKRFDRGAPHEWPWVPVMRSPVLDVQPPLSEPVPDPEEVPWDEQPF